MAAQINIPVANVATLIGLGFNKLEIYTSANDGGSYEEITASTASSAVLESYQANTMYRVGGSHLRVVVDGGNEQVVTFEDVLIYWTAEQIVSKINQTITGLASVLNGRVRLTSPTTGRGSSLKVLEQDTLLQWIGGEVCGKDARVALDEDVLIYTYTDMAGSLRYLYKWRFSYNGLNPISDFSVPPVYGKDPYTPGVDLSVGYAYFVGSDGRPAVRKLIVAPAPSPAQLGDYSVVGAGTYEIVSDAMGFLQTTFVRGTVVRIAIEGTTYIREITIPDEGSFNILETMASAPEYHTVQQVPPILNRMTL